MKNLNKEERSIKLKSASYTLKNYIDYFHIEDNLNSIYKKLSMGNNFIEPENLIEYLKEKGLELEKRNFTQNQFLKFSRNLFPFIAVVTKNGLDTYIIVEKRVKNSLIILENETRKTITIEQFFNATKYEYIIPKDKHSYIDFKFALDETKEIIKSGNTLVETLGIQAFVYLAGSIFGVIWLKAFKDTYISDNIFNYLLIVISFILLGLQVSLLSQSNQVIKGISLVNDVSKIDKYLYKSFKQTNSKEGREIYNQKSDYKKTTLHKETSITNLILTLTFNGIISTILLFIIMTNNIVLGLIILLLSSIISVFAIVMGEKSYILNLKMKISEKEYFNFLENFKNSVDENILTSESESIYKTKSEKFSNYAKTCFQLERLGFLFKTSVDCIVILIISLFLILHENSNKTLSVYTLLVFYIIPFVMPFRQFVFKLFEKSEIEYDYYVINETLKKSNNNQIIKNNKGEEVEEDILKKELIIKNTQHSFFHNKPVLKNINIKIPKGKTVVIHGESGSGKTVLANIILQNIKADKGEIFFDDVPLKNISKDKLRENIVFIPQSIKLFNASILDNITMFEKIPMKYVVEVCKTLGIHSEIQKKPFNYKTIVDDNGDILSEIEMKKIALARAILKTPDILFIDDITDVFSDKDIEQINNLIIRNKSVKTVLLFARKIPKNLDYDIAYKINNGYIEEKEVVKK